jgi:hypothetical protein
LPDVQLQWKTTPIEAEYEGKVEKWDFHWKEPMAFLEELVTDPDLMKHSHFHAEQKFLCENGNEERLRDEPWTGDEWHNIEVSIFPHD